MGDLNSVSASNFASPRGICYWKFVNVGSSFWRADCGKKKVFVLFSKRRSGVGRSPTNKTAGNMDRVKEGNCLRNQKNYYLWICQNVGNFIWVRPEYFEDNLKVCRISAKFVPCLLNEEDSFNTCWEVKERLGSDTESKSKIFTGDEKWVDVRNQYHNDPGKRAVYTCLISNFTRSSKVGPFDGLVVKGPKEISLMGITFIIRQLLLLWWWWRNGLSSATIWSHHVQ